MKKKQRTGDTIGAVIEFPRELSLKLSMLILEKSERGIQLTKPELIIQYVEKGVKQELENV